MPRAEPLNDKIIEALESRKKRAELLNQPKQFQYKTAINLIRRHPGNITKLSQVVKLCGAYKITQAIFNEIAKVVSNEEDVEVDPPTSAQIARAQAHGPIQQRLPGVGTGAGAILRVLYRETLKPDGADTMTKDEIRETALEELDVDMYSEVRGFTKWSGIKSLEAKKWVKRDAYSKQYGAWGSGGWGGRKDEFSITAAGKAVAAQLEAQAGVQLAAAGGGGSDGGGSGGARGNRYHGGGGGSSGGGDDPFTAALGRFMQGPQFIRGSAPRSDHALPVRRSAAASPFSGKGRVIGHDSSHWSAAAAAVAGPSRAPVLNVEDYLYEDELIAEEFQLSYPEWFTNAVAVPAAAASTKKHHSDTKQLRKRRTPGQMAAAAAEARAQQVTRSFPQAAAAAESITILKDESAQIIDLADTDSDDEAGDRLKYKGFAVTASAAVPVAVESQMRKRQRLQSLPAETRIHGDTVAAADASARVTSVSCGKGKRQRLE